MKNKKTLAAVVLAVIAGSAGAAEPIKIGVAGPHTGDLAPYGLPVKNAVELAVDNINAAGGVNGRMLKVYAEDDACDPNIATNVADKLIGEGVDLVIGHICSGATTAAMPKYKNAGKLVISPSSTTPDLTLKGSYPNFFRTISHDLKQAELLADFAINILRVKTAAVVHDKQDYGKGLAEGVKNNLEKAGVNVKLFEGVTSGAPDYAALVAKLKKNGVDEQGTAVFYAGYHPEASKIITGARRAGSKAYFLGGDGLKDPAFLDIAKQFALNFYVSAPVDTSRLLGAIEVTKEYKERFGEDVGVFSLAGYAAVQAVAKAIKTAGGSTDWNDLKKALTGQVVDTAIGEISFDENGDVIGTGFKIYQVKPEYVEVDY